VIPSDSGGAYGENLYMGSGTITPADGVSNWNDERSGQGGHWTQVVSSDLRTREA
jgi:hypothetical protein